LRAACDYPALAERLPTLVTDAQAVAFEAVNEDERRIGLDVFVKACVFGALALKTSGYVDLAVRLAERGQAAADQLGSPVHVAAARFALCQGLMAEGVRRRALAIASRSADELTTQLASADGAQGWYVHLRLQAALSAASLGDHAQAAGHLQDAAEVATRPAGPDLWHRDDLATNVDIWRITVALENGGNLENGGDPERAPDLARRVDRSKPLLSGPTGLIGHDYAAWDHQDHQAGGAGVTSAGAGMSWRAGRSPLLGAQSRGPSSLQRMGRK
jgi:hypothetical protein